MLNAAQLGKRIGSTSNSSGPASFIRRSGPVDPDSVRQSTGPEERNPMTAARGRVQASTVLGRQGARLGFRPRHGESCKPPQVRPRVRSDRQRERDLRTVISAERHSAQTRGRVTQRRRLTASLASSIQLDDQSAATVVRGCGQPLSKDFPCGS